MEKRGITATLAAILDFIQTAKTGHHFGQQLYHCRLGERPFHIRFQGFKSIQHTFPLDFASAIKLEK